MKGNKKVLKALNQLLADQTEAVAICASYSCGFPLAPVLSRFAPGPGSCARRLFADVYRIPKRLNTKN
jgi:hypothetical protein